MARALLDAAVAHAQQYGATAVEGHPVDTDALKAERTSGSALFTGTMRLFVAAGFGEIGRALSQPSRDATRVLTLTGGSASSWVPEHPVNGTQNVKRMRPPSPATATSTDRSASAWRALPNALSGKLRADELVLLTSGAALAIRA